MSLNTRIRLAKASDIVQVSQLVHSLSRYYLKDEQQTLPHWFADTLTQDAFAERFASVDFANFVYEEAGIIYGYIAIKKPHHLYHLFVKASMHHRGLGTRLWQYVVETLSLNHAEVVMVRASLNAVPFYNKLGFEVTDTVNEKEGIQYQPMQWQSGRNTKLKPLQ